MGEKVDGRDWLDGEGPAHLWMCIEPEDGKSASARKRRLFVVALCRRLWDLFSDERSRTAVVVAERYADGRASEAELTSARGAAHVWAQSAAELAAVDAAAPDDSLRLAFFNASETLLEVGEDIYTLHMTLLHEIFSDRLRPAPVAFDAAWRTSDVMALATGIYEEKAFDRLPILADALQDAGCDAEELLSHLRDVNATHVRGCWGLDLVLGKE